MNSNLTYFQSPCSNDDEESSFSSMAKFRFSPGITLLIYIIYLLPFCFGVFGNISVCLIFFQQKKLRSITNTFLMNLCLNDLIVLCVSIPMTLSAALLENWIFGSFLCKLVHFTSTLTALISTFTVAVISVERWFFIVNKQKFDRRCTIMTLVLLWSISICISLPEFLSRQVQEVYPQMFLQYMYKFYQMANRTDNDPNPMQNPCPIEKRIYCVSKPGLRMRIFSYIIMTVQYLVPFLFVSVSCYSISRFLKRRMERMRLYQTPHRPIVTRKNAKKSSTSTNHQDEITEQELTSYDDLPTNQDDSRSSHAIFERFRHPFQLHEQHQYLKTQSHTERRFHRSRKLLICVAALFTISWLPLTIIQIYLDHNEEILNTRDGANYVYGYLLIPCYLISSLSAWVNPVIYNYINRSFRREFYSLYSCCFPVSRTTSTIERKEITSVIGKRERNERSINHQEKTHERLPIRSGTASVSFADQTVVMMH